jgi:AhpD family alkylhydroperoxidase
MTRVSPPPAREVGLQITLVNHVIRRGFTKILGRAPDRMLEPLEVRAHLPKVLLAYQKLEGATSKLDRNEERLRILVQLKAAQVTSCEYCIDLGSQFARKAGIGDEELLALSHHRESGLFTELEMLVLDYAAGATRTPVDVPDELFAELREHLDDAQIVELTHLIALENYRGRFNMALDIGAAGFSEGMVCVVPEHVSAELAHAA